MIKNIPMKKNLKIKHYEQNYLGPFLNGRQFRHVIVKKYWELELQSLLYSLTLSLHYDLFITHRDNIKRPRGHSRVNLFHYTSESTGQKGL